jgi:4-hydroxybenzoate polyprenyltransferase
MANRWWIYQRERFPVAAYGLLVAVFSLSALTFTAVMRGQGRWPEAGTFLVASVCAFLFFVQLRIFDEWKDYEEDSRYRPYRAVPRGLVTLSELRRLWFLTAAVQVGLVFWQDAHLLPLLLVVWGYMGLMGNEFFVRRWLKAHAAMYLWSHMLILPLIYLFVMACGPGIADQAERAAMGWFLFAGFFCGVVIEIGRKIRAPDDEEHGVETYTALWGRRGAVDAWMAALALSALGACLAAREIHFLGGAGWILGLGLGIAAAMGASFLKNSSSSRAKAIEQFSGVWSLLVHLSLGPVALLVWKLGNHART